MLHANTLTARQKEEIADLRKLNMQLYTSLETLRVQLDSAEQRCNSQELAGEHLNHCSSWVWTVAERQLTAGIRQALTGEHHLNRQSEEVPDFLGTHCTLMDKCEAGRACPC